MECGDLSPLYRRDDKSSQQHRVQRCGEQRKTAVTTESATNHSTSRSARLCLSDKSLRPRKRRQVSALQKLSGSSSHTPRETLALV